MTDTYITTRSIMGRDELAAHKKGAHGRDFSRSDDGYGDLEVAESEHWHAVSGWGRDGWDLGDWPYVIIYTRRWATRFQVQQVVEGDHTIYEFDTVEDRDAAVDYLFLWYGANRSFMPLSCGDREALDAGGFEVDPMWRGPYNITRHTERAVK